MDTGYNPSATWTKETRICQKFITQMSTCEQSMLLLLCYRHIPILEVIYTMLGPSGGPRLDVISLAWTFHEFAGHKSWMLVVLLKIICWKFLRLICRNVLDGHDTVVIFEEGLFCGILSLQRALLFSVVLDLFGSDVDCGAEGKDNSCHSCEMWTGLFVCLFVGCWWIGKIAVDAKGVCLMCFGGLKRR